MNIRELYQTCFGDGDAFTDTFFRDRGAFPVTVEEDGRTIAMLLAAPRSMAQRTTNPTRVRRYGYEPSPAVAMIGGVCVDPEFRNRGYGSKLMRKALEVCRELGFFAVFLSPEAGKEDFYARLGFETIEFGGVETVPFRKERGVKAFRLGAEKDMAELGDPDPLASSVRLIVSAARDSAALAYGVKDIERLMREGDALGGLYLLKDAAGYVGLVMKDGNHLPLTVFPDIDVGIALARTTYAGQRIFYGCTYFVLSPRPSPERQAYMMAYFLRKEEFERSVTAGVGDFDGRFYLFERY